MHIQVKQQAYFLMQRGDYKTRKDTKYCFTKLGPNTKSHIYNQFTPSLSVVDSLFIVNYKVIVLTWGRYNILFRTIFVISGLLKDFRFYFKKPEPELSNFTRNIYYETSKNKRENKQNTPK